MLHAHKNFNQEQKTVHHVYLLNDNWRRGRLCCLFLCLQKMRTITIIAASSTITPTAAPTVIKILLVMMPGGFLLGEVEVSSELELKYKLKM